MSRIPPRIRWRASRCFSLDECLDVCDHVVIALGHREFLSPQARAKILSVPHYDCIGFEQGEKR
ncbi:MAG: hypothetical protein V8T10_03520 [Merdibacter sp.]